MADEAPVMPVAPAPSSPAPDSQGPVAATPQVAAPVTVEAPAVLSPAPAAAVPAPVAVEAVPVEPKPPEAPGSLLSDATSKTPEVETAKEDGDKKPEVPAEADAGPLPTYEAYALPEGVKLDDGSVGKFNEVLGKFEQTTGVDHATAQALGQQFLDLYLSEKTTEAERARQAQVLNWERTNNDWKAQVKSDPEIGGNRYDTTIRQSAAVLERYGQIVGADKEKALRAALGWTGAGNNVEVVRFMNWASRFVTEQARPVAALVPKAPQVKSPRARRYPTLDNGAA